MEAYYQSNEKVRILEERELDYIIQDLTTNQTYEVDKTYFHRKYEQLFETDTYSQLRAELDKLNRRLGGVINENKNLKSANKGLRKVIAKKNNKKQHYKNGKRGTMKNGG